MKLSWAAASVLAGVVAHSGVEPAEGDSWQVRHMKTEHGFDEFDPHSFFTLHDNDGSKTWDRNDVLNLYGLLKTEQVGDGSGIGSEDGSKAVDDETKDRVYHEVLQLLDKDGDGKVSIDEWRQFSSDGGELPDFGLGPGHHGDYEYEYEVHHWQKYHAGVDPEVKIVHPEDVEHERLYHQFEHGDSAGDAHMGSVMHIQRVPKKFRRE